MIAIDLSKTPSSALTERLYAIREKERALLVEFLHYLAEVERRKVHLEAGYGSLYVFLLRYLGYSNGSAYRRMTAAQMLIRFPAIAGFLADGRLCLTTLVVLRDVLDEANCVQTLERAAGKTEEEVRQLVAAMAPEPAQPDLLRRLPQRQQQPAPESPSAPTPTPPPAPRPAATRVEPISEELHSLRVTVSREFVADLKAARAALSHVIPDGSFEKVLHECLRRTLRDIARRREGAALRPREEPAMESTSRHVPRAVLREVFARDGGCCTYVGPTGIVCGSTYQVQVHHLHAYGMGGVSTASNLALRCMAHNLLHAEQDYGREHIRRAIARGQQLSLV